MKLDMSWADLHMLSVLSKIGLPIFFVFSVIRILKFILLKFACVNKYLDDKANNINIILNYITAYKNWAIIVLGIVLTLFILFNFKTFEIERNYGNAIMIFIYLFGLLSVFIQLFFGI